MGEGMHTTQAQGGARRQRHVWLWVGGTAVVLLTAGVLVQVTRPPSAFPGEGNGGQPAATAPAGTARTTSADPSAGRTNNYVARVNKQLITWDEVARECMNRHGQEVLDSIINRKLIQQACESRNIIITDTEVNEEIIKIAKQFNLAVDQWLQMLQSERNITPDQYRRDIIWPMLALRKLADERVDISQEDLKQAFLRNYGKRVKCRAIVLDNLRRANEVWEKARRTPDDFPRLAREFSIDPASRPLEGAIPPIPRYSGNAPLENAAFRLREGEISGVIQISENSWVILKCEGYTEQIVEDIKDVENILRTELQKEKSQASSAKVFEQLRKQARIDNYLTGVSTGGDRSVGTATGSPIQQVGGTAPTRTAPATGNAGNANLRQTAPTGSSPSAAPGTATTKRPVSAPK